MYIALFLLAVASKSPFAKLFDRPPPKSNLPIVYHKSCQNKSLFCAVLGKANFGAKKFFVK
jgi:hypothetical protein